MPDHRIPIINAGLIILASSLPYLCMISHLTVTGSDNFITIASNYLLSSFLSVFFVNMLLLTFSWIIIALIYWILLKYFNKQLSYSAIFKIMLQCLMPLIFSRIILAVNLYLALPNVNIIEGQSFEVISSRISLLFGSYNWIFYKFVDAGVWLWSALLLSISFKEYFDIDFKRSLFISYIVIISYLILLNIPL